MKRNIIIVAVIVILVVVLTGAYKKIGIPNLWPKTISQEEAKAKTLDFVKNKLVAPGTEVNVKSISEENGMYKIVLAISDSKTKKQQDNTTYLTKDGTRFFPEEGIDLVAPAKETADNSAATPSAQKDIPKSDTPEVNLFVMSYCPYGTQIEKGILPALDALKNKVKLKDKSVVLTFDDGWESQYKYAVPILEKYKFPATFFIITNYTTRPYMSWDELKDLVKNGFDIGSHTENHPPLTKRKEDQLKNEILGSKKALEDKLGITVTTLAYPYYLENKNVRDVVQKSGYLGARAGWAKYKNSLDVIYELKSQEVVNNPNPFLEKRLPDLP